MPASFPAAVKNFGAAKQDFTDNVLAAHVNDLQDEVVGVEGNLGVNPHIGQNLSGNSTTYGSLKARIDDIMSGVRTHTHDGTQGVKLTQANSHQSPDTDTAPASIHHTLGTTANQAAAGNHAHTGMATLTGTETLTNKTLTTPIVNGTTVGSAHNGAENFRVISDGTVIGKAVHVRVRGDINNNTTIAGSYVELPFESITQDIRPSGTAVPWTSANKPRIYAPVSGLYLVRCSFGFGDTNGVPNASWGRYEIRVNGVVQEYGGMGGTGQPGFGDGPTTVGTVVLNAGDYVTFAYVVTGGVNPNVVRGDSNYASITLIGTV